jgi:hypothetical protein
MIWLDASIGTTTLLIKSMPSPEHSGQTDNATRGNAKATMDHADIRGLGYRISSVRRGAA